MIGPEQSWKAIGSPRASASAAHLRAKLTPPPQVTSTIGVATARVSISACTWPRPPSVSPPASGARVAAASAGSSCSRSMKIGSSTQSMPIGSSAAQIFFAAVEAPQAVQLGLQPHALAVRGAHFLEGRKRLLQVGGGDVHAVRRAGGKVERPDLHRRDSHLEQRRGELVGAVQEGIEVLVAPAARRTRAGFRPKFSGRTAEVFET